MYKIIYSSRPFGFDGPLLSGLLIDSRENNEKNNITGSLICRADIYLQMLEGPKKKVLEIFEKIKQDDRHLEIVILSEGPTTERLFPNWAMKDDPLETWMWSQEEVANGAVQNAPEEEILNIFRNLAATGL